MKKLIIGLFLLVFMSNHVFASIDESQTDLYYANGMLMDLSEPQAERSWENRVHDLKQQNPKKFKNVNAKMAYNSSALKKGKKGTLPFFRGIKRFLRLYFEA